MRIRGIQAVLCLSALASGCATVAFQTQGREAVLNDPVTPLSPVYSRTHCDAVMIHFPFWAFFGEYDHSGDNAYATTYACLLGPFMIVGGLVDMPISLIIDTCTFPRDLHNARRQEKNKESQPTDGEWSHPHCSARSPSGWN